MENPPRKLGHPMDVFVGEFLERYARHWKPRTGKTNARIFREDILPAFEHLAVDAVAAWQVRRTGSCP